MAATGWGIFFREKLPLAWGGSLTSVFLFFVVASLATSPFLVFPLAGGAHFYDNQRLVEISCVLFALVLVWFQLMQGSGIPQLFGGPLLLLLARFFLLGLVFSGTAHSPRHPFIDRRL